MLGPIPAVISRLRGHWRYQVLVKGKEHRAMIEALGLTFQKVVLPKELRVAVDVDPMSLL